MKTRTRLLAILATLALLAGCTGRVRQIPETATTFPGYAVRWPADASTNPADYDTTVTTTGRMVTTTRKGH